MATHSQTTSPRDVIHLLHRASQSADDLLTSRISQLGVTPRQLTVLMAVRDLTNASQTSLVDRTGIDRSTLADIVRRLVGSGALQRQRAEHDARMYAVQLTAKGENLLEAAEPMVQAVAEEVLAALPNNVRPALVDGLTAIVTTLGPVASARVSPRAKLAAE